MRLGVAYYILYEKLFIIENINIYKTIILIIFYKYKYFFVYYI